MLRANFYILSTTNSTVRRNFLRRESNFCKRRWWERSKLSSKLMGPCVMRNKQKWLLRRFTEKKNLNFTLSHNKLFLEASQFTLLILVLNSHLSIPHFSSLLTLLMISDYSSITHFSVIRFFLFLQSLPFCDLWWKQA